MYFLIHRDAATKHNNTNRLKDFTIENILKPSHADTSPILGKMDG